MRSREKTQMEKWLNIKTGEMQRNQPKRLTKRGHRGRRNRRVMIWKPSADTLLIAGSAVLSLKLSLVSQSRFAQSCTSNPACHYPQVESRV